MSSTNGLYVGLMLPFIVQLRFQVQTTFGMELCLQLITNIYSFIRNKHKIKIGEHWTAISRLFNGTLSGMSTTTSHSMWPLIFSMVYIFDSIYCLLWLFLVFLVLHLWCYTYKFCRRCRRRRCCFCYIWISYIFIWSAKICDLLFRSKCCHE